MALAASIIKKGVAGNMRINVVDFTLDGAYAAGGYAVTAANCGMSTIHAVAPTPQGDGIVAIWDVTNSKLKLYKGANTVTVTTGNAELTELATNDTIIDANSKVRALVVGDVVTG
jgi:hypothetical protein